MDFMYFVEVMSVVVECGIGQRGVGLGVIMIWGKLLEGSDCC